MDREQLDQSYTKDRHSSVRILFQETTALGEFRREGAKDGNLVLCAVMALYIMDLDILCVDAKVFMDAAVPPSGMSDLKKRVLETHTFPAAVRRSILVTDEITNELRARVYTALGERFTAA